METGTLFSVERPNMATGLNNALKRRESRCQRATGRLSIRRHMTNHSIINSESASFVRYEHLLARVAAKLKAYKASLLAGLTSHGAAFAGTQLD